jgi:hypothetical protein
MKPKHLAVFAVLLVLATAAAGFFAYRAGYQRALGLQRGTFVLTLAALQDMRAGKTEEATSRIESLCYSSALTMLQSPRWHDTFSMQTFRPELIEYRRRYAKPEAEWTPAEQILEGYLRK